MEINKSIQKFLNSKVLNLILNNQTQKTHKIDSESNRNHF